MRNVRPSSSGLRAKWGEGPGFWRFCHRAWDSGGSSHHLLVQPESSALRHAGTGLALESREPRRLLGPPEVSAPEAANANDVGLADSGDFKGRVSRIGRSDRNEILGESGWRAMESVMLLWTRFRGTLLIGLFLLSPSAFAGPRKEADGVPVCTAPSFQGQPAVVGDGAGGAFVAWADVRNGREDIFAQHVLASGIINPRWPADGLAVCTAARNQTRLRMIADGSGGAIITWSDYRVSDYSGYADIYAQRIIRSGTVDPDWPIDGRAVCAAEGDQESPELMSDDSGGAIVVWRDKRHGGDDVFAQRVTMTGVLDPTWPVDGLAVCTASGGQGDLAIAQDENGGAIVIWTDDRDDGSDIYCHRVLATGAVDPVWPINGRAVCTAGELQGAPVLVGDGKGGAIVAWEDARTGSFPYSNHFDIYAHHVLASGRLDPAWPADGQALCTAGRGQVFPEIVSDGDGGAIVAWIDGRGFRKAIYGHHVLPTGVPDPAWDVDGVALCTAAPQFGFGIAEDGFGGAMLAWEDWRGTGSDVYAQRVRATGEIDRGWDANGSAVCTSDADQFDVTIAGVGGGQAIVAWRDHRNGNGDIYARRVHGRGFVVPPRPKPLRTPRLQTAGPSSARGNLTISLDLPAPQPVTVTLFDLAGRAVRNLAAGKYLEAGAHEFAWDGRDNEGAALGRGIYLVRVKAGTEAEPLTGKILKLR